MLRLSKWGLGWAAADRSPSVGRQRQRALRGRLAGSLRGIGQGQSAATAASSVRHCPGVANATASNGAAVPPRFAICRQSSWDLCKGHHGFDSGRSGRCGAGKGCPCGCGLRTDGRTGDGLAFVISHDARARSRVLRGNYCAPGGDTKRYATDTHPQNKRCCPVSACINRPSLCR
jgi:hypothetical protein